MRKDIAVHKNMTGNLNHLTAAGSMPGDSELRHYAEEEHAVLAKLARIPAPSGQEGARAAFIMKYLKENGVPGVTEDSAGNIIAGAGKKTTRTEKVVFLAHTDIVFPDTEMLPYAERGGKIFCPGIGDNSANAAALLVTAKILALRGQLPEDGSLLLVFNTGEEGLGNLRGSRQIFADYGRGIRRVISLDSTSPEIVRTAVGSRRFRITAQAEGGHSFRDFGRPNAIEALAFLIEKFYAMELPAEGRTTFNVGTINGGTSVNAIAQRAEMLFEIRSDRASSLESMVLKINRLLESPSRTGVSVTAEVIGERPCTGDVDEKEQEALAESTAHLLEECTGDKAVMTSGSTDCNIFLKEGIPSVCVGCCRGRGAHTREEYIETESLLPGLRLALMLTEELGMK